MNGSGAGYLMIEDNGCDVEIALFDFEERGIGDLFHIASNGAEALDYLFAEDGSLRIEPPKAIFLDLHMPKIGGLEFLKSSTSPSELSECQQLGVHDFIDKPLEFVKFIDAIRDIENC
jgi:two-component system, response regulator